MTQGWLHCCLKIITLFLTVSLGTRAWADSDTLQFSEGSLIIPMSANFQDACGVVSAYGLVWRLLQANQPGHYFALRNHLITVYVALNAEKASPNRCVPSNLSTAPPPSSDPNWNDGCDLAIEIQNPGPNQQPVVPVDYGPAFPASGFYTNASIPMLDTRGLTVTVAGARTFPYATPEYGAIQLDNTVNPRFTRIQYGGAPFIIDAPDASIVIDFLHNGDSYVPPAALAPFITGSLGRPECATLPQLDKHYVQMHQATIAFSAPIGRRINTVPPKIAVLDTGAGVKWESVIYPPAHVLETYLQYANLFYDDPTNHLSAAGCPLDSVANCRRNGSDPDAGVMYPGQIYDEFNSYHDLISRAAPYDHGLLNAVDGAGVPRYRVLWTPHWEITQYGDWNPSTWNYAAGTPPNYAEYVPNGDGAGSDQIQNSLNNIGYFMQQRGHGVMAECASIGAMEGTMNTGYPITSTSTQSMFTNKADDNEVNGAAGLYDGKNCTDPDYASGECMLYRGAANPFSQIGDFHFVSQSGTIYSMGRKPPTTDYRSGVVRLAVTWYNAISDPPPRDLSTYVATPGNNNGWDIINFGFKDNVDRKAAIIYVGGHEYGETVAGVRIILGILMHLGWAPTGVERALTAPIGLRDQNYPTGDPRRNIVLSSTYTAVTGLPPAATTFSPAQGSMWRFPLSRGHLRAHQLQGVGSLALGESNLDSATLWDVEDGGMPPPSDRNLFTYFGGSVKFSSSAPHNVIQDSWTPAPVAGTAIGPGCVDVMALGQNPLDNTFGMFPHSGGDGICDLQEAAQYTRADPGTDFGVAERPAYLAALASDLPNTQQMLQMVRGYCFALDVVGNPILTPADSDCVDLVLQDNRAHVGGFAHASVAISPPSPNIPDQGASDGGTVSRPTVAFIGGLDGQLHALYVSGGAGYQGPQSPIATRSTNANASTVFVRDWSSAFSLGNTPRPGTELWSFIPASQLPQLRSNNARVDSSGVVSDVFDDFSGNGLRTWHTVLVISIGGQNRELFALDVTNPLKPQLLWDIVGSLMLSSPDYPYYSPTVLSKGPDPGGTDGQSIKWLQSTTLFQLPPASDPGRLGTGFYDYTDLGGSVGLSMGQLRVGVVPFYAVFVASNVSGKGGLNKGLEVFAINAATGQKLWQFEQTYSPTSWADNAVPPPVSLWPGLDGLNRAFAGDQEGNVWELDPRWGVNVNTLSGTADCPSGNPCKFPVLSTQSSSTRHEPISTTLALAKIPSSATDVTGALSAYQGKTLLIVGTAGADWVSFANAGELHVALLDDQYRLPVKNGGYDLSGNPLTATAAVTLARRQGITQEPLPFPLSFTGKHLFGSLTVSGQMVFFGAATVRFPIDMYEMNRLSGLIAGATYAIDLGTVATGVTGDGLSPFGGYNLANFGGGVAVFNVAPSGNPPDTYIVGLEVSQITMTHIPTDTHPAPTPSLGYTSQGNLVYRLKSWLTRFLNP